MFVIEKFILSEVLKKLFEKNSEVKIMIDYNYTNYKYNEKTDEQRI